MRYAIADRSRSTTATATDAVPAQSTYSVAVVRAELHVDLVGFKNSFVSSRRFVALQTVMSRGCVGDGEDSDTTMRLTASDMA